MKNVPVVLALSVGMFPYERTGPAGSLRISSPTAQPILQRSPDVDDLKLMLSLRVSKVEIPAGPPGRLRNYLNRRPRVPVFRGELKLDRASVICVIRFGQDEFRIHMHFENISAVNKAVNLDKLAR
jgi:hypothetical protein